MHYVVLADLNDFEGRNFEDKEICQFFNFFQQGLGGFDRH